MAASQGPHTFKITSKTGVILYDSAWSEGVEYQDHDDDNDSTYCTENAEQDYLYSSDEDANDDQSQPMHTHEDDENETDDDSHGHKTDDTNPIPDQPVSNNERTEHIPQESEDNQSEGVSDQENDESSTSVATKTLSVQDDPLLQRSTRESMPVQR